MIRRDIKKHKRYLMLYATYSKKSKPKIMKNQRTYLTSMIWRAVKIALKICEMFLELVQAMKVGNVFQRIHELFFP